jgi:CubicO group peptidase (beta-lactamase class C family)
VQAHYALAMAFQILRGLLLLFLALPLPAIGQTLAATDAPHRASVIVTFGPKAIHTRWEHGLADEETGRAVRADDPVRVASISKVSVALAVMRLVEQRKLSLDADVSDYLGWTLRNPGFPDQPISLRLLMSHRSSLMDGGELYLVPFGERLQGHLSDSRVWDTAHAPGRYFRYGNINFPVIATIIEKVTGERFDRAMQRLVFAPLSIDACFNWTMCSPQKIARAVVLYGEDGRVRRDDLKGVMPPCPVFTRADGQCDLSTYQPGDNGAIFSPQGGLRISMTDLARFGQVLMRRDPHFLKPASYAVLEKIVWRFDGRNGDTEGGFFCAFGLSVQTVGLGKTGCPNDAFGDGQPRVGHAGEAYGLRAGLWIDRKRKEGVAFFVTAVPDEELKGPSGFYRVEEAILQSPYVRPDR